MCIDVYWFEQTAGGLPADDGWLSAAEAARSNTMRIPKRRADWRLGRWTAKQAVAQTTVSRGLPSLATIEIRPASTGAPEVFISGEPAPITISLSHRAGVAVCAVAPPSVALGCDVELVEPRSAAFASDYFTAEEQALATSPRILTLLWSVKESVLKALHEGLRLDPRCVLVDPSAISPAEENKWSPFRASYAGQSFHGWWQQTGDLVRTIAALPKPNHPAQLPIRYSVPQPPCRA